MSSPRVSIVVIAEDGPQQQPDRALTRSLDSSDDQLSGGGIQRILAGRPAEVWTDRDDLDRLALPGATPAELRNAALAACKAPLVVLLEPSEQLAPGALERHVSALEGEDCAASYGRTAVRDEEGRTRSLPQRGKGGEVEASLLRDRHLLASSAALVWRRDALGEAPFSDHVTGPARRLDLALRLARGNTFSFHPAVVAERSAERLGLSELEELVRVLVGLVFAPDSLPAELEEPARRRLARHLVGMGKLHYRAEDYPRAGKLFDEAVRTAPHYFRGRRYQFLNFVKNTISRG